MDIRLIGIDWQNDFVDPKGALPVKGAEADAKRCADMILRLKNKWTDIHMTMDSHRYMDIAHPIWWIDQNGNHPNPFTIITEDDVNNNIWEATLPQYRKKSIDYIRQLTSNNRYPLCIWPPHCLIGGWGHSLYPGIFNALLEWEKTYAMVDYITKGSNPFTEHYSAIQADVPDSDDPQTMLNTKFLDMLAKADFIALTGQALSHCLANTVIDIANNFGDENIKKLVLIEDCSSSVEGFENFGEDFIKKMTGRGMQISNSVDFLQ